MNRARLLNTTAGAIEYRDRLTLNQIMDRQAAERKQAAAGGAKPPKR